MTHATAHPDVAPTVFAALGLPIPDGIEGRPIVEALRPEVVAALVTAVGSEAAEGRAATNSKGGGGAGTVQRRPVGEIVHEECCASR